MDWSIHLFDCLLLTSSFNVVDICLVACVYQWSNLLTSPIKPNHIRCIFSIVNLSIFPVIIYIRSMANKHHIRLPLWNANTATHRLADHRGQVNWPSQRISNPIEFWIQIFPNILPNKLKNYGRLFIRINNSQFRPFGSICIHSNLIVNKYLFSVKIGNGKVPIQWKKRNIVFSGDIWPNTWH